MDLVGNDMDTLHEEIEHLVSHLVENDVDTFHEERIHIMGFSFIRATPTNMLSMLFRLFLHF